MELFALYKSVVRRICDLKIAATYPFYFGFHGLPSFDFDCFETFNHIEHIIILQAFWNLSCWSCFNCLLIRAPIKRVFRYITIAINKYLPSFLYRIFIFVPAVCSMAPIDNTTPIHPINISTNDSLDEVNFEDNAW